MLSKAQITTASSTLDEVDINMMATLVRSSQRFREDPAYYNDVDSKIALANGTTKGKMLNAVLEQISILGIGEVALDGGDEGVRYSKTREREALINYAISVIYSRPFETTTGDENSVSNYGVGQRDLESYEGYL